MSPEEQAKQLATANKLRKGDIFKSDLGLVTKPKEVDPSMVVDPEKLKQKKPNITA